MKGPAFLLLLAYTAVLAAGFVYAWRKGPSAGNRAMAGGFLTTRFDALLSWGRKYSLFHYPFITACCGMDTLSTACAHYDIDRFGAGMTRFSPRQADMLLVVGTINRKWPPC